MPHRRNRHTTPAATPAPLRALVLALGLALLALAGVACGDDDPGPAGGTATVPAPPTTTTTVPAPSTATTPADAEPAAVEPVESGLDTTEVGPWVVGMRTVTVAGDPARDRPLVATVWYPADPGTTGEPGRYDFLPGIGIDSELALGDAPAAAGPFPLVVFSHGNTGLRYQSAFSTEHLASWGFVVVSADHPGDTVYDELTGTWEGNDRHPRERILDVTQLIDGMAALAATPGDPFEGRVDTGRVGVYGHSMGGHTAVGAAAGLDEFPAGPAPADPRVAAVAAFGPYTGLFTDANLADLTVPFLLSTGTADDTTPIDPDVTRPWALAPGEPRYRIDLLDAAHFVFTDICRYEAAVPTFTDPPAVLVGYIEDRAASVCAPGLPSWRAVQDVARRAVAAFFLTTLTPSAPDAAAAREALDALVPGGEVLLTFPPNEG